MPRLDHSDWPEAALRHKDRIVGIWIGNCAGRVVLDLKPNSKSDAGVQAHAHCVGGVGDHFHGWICAASRRDLDHAIEHEIAHLIEGRGGHDAQFYKTLRAVWQKGRGRKGREGEKTSTPRVGR
jgi:hypothetical protein